MRLHQVGPPSGQALNGSHDLAFKTFGCVQLATLVLSGTAVCDKE